MHTFMQQFALRLEQHKNLNEPPLENLKTEFIIQKYFHFSNHC